MERGVGIRQLRDRLTHYLGRVRRGRQLIITDRGEPVALLLPYGRGGRPDRSERLHHVLSGGHVMPAERQFLKTPPLVKGRGPLLSDIVSEGRR